MTRDMMVSLIIKIAWPMAMDVPGGAFDEFASIEDF